MKTIKQIADELGVTKEAVRKRAANLPPEMVTTGSNRQKLINDEGTKILTEEIASSANRVATNVPPTLPLDVGTIITTLQEELKHKNTLIESQQQSISELTAALEHTTTSLQAAQALHAGTMQKQIASHEEEPPAAAEEKRGLFARLFKPK